MNKAGSEIIRHNLNRAIKLTESFKQIAVDQTTDEKRLFNVKQYLDEILLSLHPKLKQTKIVVNTDVDHLLDIYSYPSALAQIVTNFITNSIRYAFDRQASGNIVIQVSEDANNNIHVNYKDDGKGIESEQLDQIFNPFYTTGRGIGGAGLGLSIVYNLVSQKLNGTIKAESTPATGLSFYIEFPAESPPWLADSNGLNKQLE